MATSLPMTRLCLVLLLLLAPAVARANDLVAALRGGGLVLFLRHAETGQAWADQRQAAIGDCATQRDLNAAGREQARRIGEGIVRAGIPIEAVLASPYCRSIETAALAFGRALPEPALSLLPDTLSPGAHMAMGFSLASLLERLPTARGNIVLVGHSYHVVALGAPLPEPQGAAVVLRRGADGGLAVLGLLPPQAWAAPRLAQAP